MELNIWSCCVLVATGRESVAFPSLLAGGVRAYVWLQGLHLP